ncbi:MAG: RusA family crossover junction endodeoxyribonuclease [Lachnospiraceae bacterium]|nr:RusA family crossover junction endodeoxyribonuclease [Lachnospiraceae bacterium]
MAKKNEREERLIAELVFPYEAKNPNNAYARSGNVGKGFKGMFMKKEYKDYKDNLVRLAHEYMLTNYGEEYVPYNGAIEVISEWTFGTRRVKDLQNCGKLEYDALNGIVYKDDSQIHKEMKVKAYSKNNPSIRLMIYRLEDSKWEDQNLDIQKN